MIEFMRDHVYLLSFIAYLFHTVILIVAWPRRTVFASSNGRNLGMFIFAVCFHTCVTLAFSVIAVEVAK